MSFVHLHLHSEFSLLDGASRIKEIVKKAKDDGQKSVALTDHGVMYGVIDFYKEAVKEEIKPIIGCEVYVAKRSRFDKEYPTDSKSYHLILLCENNEGYQNLIKIVSKAHVEGFYNKPRVDMELLQKYSSGLIALSACLGGEIPRLIADNGYEAAKEKAIEYRDIFGRENYFLELQRHGIEGQEDINQSLIKIAREIGVGVVATNDCHYINKEDAKMQHVLMCIQMNKTIHDEKTMLIMPEFYMKTADEMETLFSDIKEAVDNTVKIADRCNVKIEFGKTKLPNFKLEEGTDKIAYFRDKCRAGLNKRLDGNITKVYEDRLSYELDTIINMGYVDYFLIVADFTNFARSKDIPVGPGRGSGAGSLAAYCLQITEIDPVKYNLLFERFLNPERVTMPDFDIDFCNERRGEVIDYVNMKYGSDHVAQIITFGTLAAKSAIRDVGRALDVPYNAVDSLAKAIPETLGMTLPKAREISTDVKNILQNDERLLEVYEMAMKVEGIARHASTHAAGVVITDKPVDDYVPLAKNDDNIVTQYTMGTLEELGLLKMDFLGLRNLTVIKDAEELIRRHTPDFSVKDCDIDDREVYEMLSRADSIGVFQFESDGLRRVMEALKPETFEDLIALISLYRPGPMDSIPKYVENRHHPEKITYMHPLLKPILDVTYGCIVYQEQVMEIFRELAGYSYAQADIVRRAMSKKKHDVMDRERKFFIYGDEKSGIDGCVNRGVSATVAEKIFDDMASFASYAFNKSHAAAYALISYWTAYLKCHYPKEYFAALISSVVGSTGKMAEYIKESKRLGIDVLPPRINISNLKFTVSKEGINFGFLGIKNVGEGFIKNIVSERDNSGEYTSFYDFCVRLIDKGLTKKSLEGLILSGSFDEFEDTRRSLMYSTENALKYASSAQRIKMSGQISMFDMGDDDEKVEEFIIPDVEEYSLMEILRFEKEMIGIYISGHPIDTYESLYKEKKIDLLSNLKDGEEVSVLVVIERLKKKLTKKKDEMAFLKVSDNTGETEVIVFPKSYSEYFMYLKEGDVFLIKGRVNIDTDETKIIMESIYTALDGVNHLKKDSSKHGLYLKLRGSSEAEMKNVMKALSISKGNLPVYLYLNDKKQLLKVTDKNFINPTETLIRQLKYILGDENVVFKD